MDRQALKAIGWHLEHTGGGIYNAHKDFVALNGETIGVSIGMDCAVACRSANRFLRADELAKCREPEEAEEILLLTPNGPTREGLRLLGNKALCEIEKALAMLD